MRSRTLGLLLLSLLIIPNLGCQTWRHTRDCFYFCEPIDEMMLSYNCHRAAKAAWKAREHHHCGRSRFDHFGLGFREGYASVAMGGTGCPPPLPHRRYWGWRYQNCEGQECVAAWFDGYPAGARAAEEDGVSNWSRMQTSYLIDAQYAARMPGNKRGALTPSGAVFPGEELEEVPLAPVATPSNLAPQTTAPTPIESPATTEAPAPTTISDPAPLAPSSEPDSATDLNEEVGAVLRKLDVPVAAVGKISDQKSTAKQPEVKVVRRIESPVEEPVSVRKFDMPAVEVLSGVSVPKKQQVNVEAVPDVEIADTTPIENGEEARQELAIDSLANDTTPTLAPIAAPTVTSRESTIVAETPAYSLGEELAGSSASVEKLNVAAPAIKRKPPIVPAQSKKNASPVVVPVERGRMAKLEAIKPTKQVSFESQFGEEAPILRRIDLSK